MPPPRNNVMNLILRQKIKNKKIYAILKNGEDLVGGPYHGTKLRWVAASNSVIQCSSSGTCPYGYVPHTGSDGTCYCASVTQ